MYEHTQPGTLIRVLFGITVLLLLAGLWLVIQSSRNQGILDQAAHDNLLRICAVLFFILATFALFHNLTVRVDASVIMLSYGIGVITKRVSLDRVNSVNAVVNPWWWGWGIRLTPRGWMWNISGRQAVELELMNGKRFRIGTDEPEALARVIRDRLAMRRS
jgi:hypothetical protein